jgi:hypothetical protein
MPSYTITVNDALSVLGVPGKNADDQGNADHFKEALKRAPSMKLTKEADKGVIDVHITNFPDKTGAKKGLYLRFSPVGTQIKVLGHEKQNGLSDDKAQLWLTRHKDSWHLEWIGQRPGTPACPYAGEDLMAFAVGAAKASEVPTFDLADASGVPLAKIETCQIALRVTGVYKDGVTWYMKYGAFPDDLGGYKKAADVLKRLKVKEVLDGADGDSKKALRGAKKKKGNGEEESKWNLGETTDLLITKLKAAKLNTSLTVGDFYMKAFKDLNGNAEAAKLLYNFYAIAMRRQVDTDPDAELAKSAKLIWDRSQFEGKTAKVSCIASNTSKLGIAIKVT